MAPSHRAAVSVGPSALTGLLTLLEATVSLDEIFQLSTILSLEIPLPRIVSPADHGAEPILLSYL